MVLYYLKYHKILNLNVKHKLRLIQTMKTWNIIIILSQLCKLKFSIMRGFYFINL